MLFSCCCAKVDRTWKGICQCKDDQQPYQCDSLCLEKSLLSSELYYDYASVSFFLIPHLSIMDFLKMMPYVAYLSGC